MCTIGSTNITFCGQNCFYHQSSQWVHWFGEMSGIMNAIYVISMLSKQPSPLHPIFPSPSYLLSNIILTLCSPYRCGALIMTCSNTIHQLNCSVQYLILFPSLNDLYTCILDATRGQRCR